MTSTIRGGNELGFFSRRNKGNNMNDSYGSVDDLQDYALKLRNHNLTVALVQAKKDWESLQASFRANTHGRFVYQTTLARIVAHVQDFVDRNKNEALLQDVIHWTQDCENIHPVDFADGQDHDKRDAMSHRTIIIDYNDVEPFVDTSTSLLTRSLTNLSMSHDSLQQQNDSLEKEITKWNKSMARIRICNQREVSELLKHQKTLRRVVDRIQDSTFCRKEDVLLWYGHCQKEAERCGSFSEKDAAEYCNRCHSKLSEDNVNVQDDDVDARDPQKAVTSSSKSQSQLQASSQRPPQRPPERPDTPTTSMEASNSADSSNEIEDTVTTAEDKKTTADIAAANVDDPPDRIDPKATNIQPSNINQVKPAGSKRCGGACAIM